MQSTPHVSETGQSPAKQAIGSNSSQKKVIVKRLNSIQNFGVMDVHGGIGKMNKYDRK